MTWANFIRENPLYQQACEELYLMLPELILQSNPQEDDQAGQVVIALLSALIIDFDDVLILASHDRYWGAFKILRSLFERVVTLKYVVQNPAVAEAFMAYDAIDWDVVLTAIEKTEGLKPLDGTMNRVKAAAAAARTRFRQEPCPQCKLRKQTSWTPKSSLELAESTGLAHLHLMCFLIRS